MSHKQYDDLSDENMFIPLNEDTHKCVHYLYSFYKKDKQVMTRLTSLLEKMYEVNKVYFIIDIKVFFGIIIL